MIYKTIYEIIAHNQSFYLANWIDKTDYSNGYTLKEAIDSFYYHNPNMVIECINEVGCIIPIKET